jgi:uncharacterized protein
MRIALTGASGFIGQRLIQRLTAQGCRLHVLGRSRPSAAPAGIEFSPWEAEADEVPDEALRRTDAIVHLAGEPVAQRWNSEIKDRIRNSRILGTRSLVQALAKHADPPHTFISASAIGYYGDRGSETLTEQSGPGTGFLSDICGEWEREALAAGGFGLRVVLLRIGIVLGKEGGALKQMLPPFRLGVGGPIASGKQWMSWIHADDLVSAIVFSLMESKVFGPVNATAPNPVQNAEFAKALGEALHRPAVLPTPAFVLRMMLGEAAAVVLASQRVMPVVLQDAGFSWAHPEIREALASVV